MVTFLMPTIRLEPSDSTIRSTRRKGYRCGNMLRMSWMFFNSWVLSIVSSETLPLQKDRGDSSMEFSLQAELSGCTAHGQAKAWALSKSSVIRLHCTRVG